MTFKIGILAAAQKLLKQYGANIAGGLWNTGNVLQLVLGTAALSPRIIISAIMNIASSSVSMVYGRKDWGVVLTCLLGLFGTSSFLYPSLARFEAGTWAGYAVFCAALLLGIFSAPLANAFHSKSAPILYNTLGHPRRMMGVMLLASRLPIITNAASHGDWDTVVPFVLWGMGDIAFCLSREEVAKP